MMLLLFQAVFHTLWGRAVTGSNGTCGGATSCYPLHYCTPSASAPSLRLHTPSIHNISISEPTRCRGRWAGILIAHLQKAPQASAMCHPTDDLPLLWGASSYVLQSPPSEEHREMPYTDSSHWCIEFSVVNKTVEGSGF